MRRKKTIRWLGVLVTALIAVSLIVAGCAKPAPPPAEVAPPPEEAPAPPPMEPITLLFDGTAHPPTDSKGKTIQWFSDEVTKRTNGLITFDYAWGFSLSKPGEAIDQTATRVSDLAFTPVAYYPTKLFLNNYAYSSFENPDLATSWKITDRLYFEEVPELAQELEQYGLKFLYFVVDTAQNVLSRAPITTLEDFEGLKIAASGHYLPGFFEAVGATGVTLTVVDRGTALQTGMIDASALPILVAYTFKHHEFAPYFLDSGIGQGRGTQEIAFMNLELFNSFPKDIQKIILDIGREATKVYLDFALEELDAVMADMESKGVTFSTLTASDRVKWSQKVGEPLAEVIADGEERGLPMRKVIETYLRLSEETGYKFSKEWKLD